MTKFEFMRLMSIPSEWETWEMYPEDLFNVQIQRFQPGDERGSEHDRNGMFHWWLRRHPTKEQLTKLAKLSFLDPDKLMAGDVRSYIRKAKDYDADVEQVLRK